MDDDYAVEWVDRTGRTRWQPECGGLTEWREGPVTRVWRVPPMHLMPVLYRWKWQAVLRAKRQERRDDRRTWSVV